MKRVGYFLLAVTVMIVLQAHEFWIAPSKFYLAAGDSLKIDLKVGEDFIGEPWAASKDRFERIELHQLQKMSDLKPIVKPAGKNVVATRATDEGSHVVVLQSTEAYIELDAEKFNAYLKEDALDEAYAFRRKNNQLDKVGKELYARYAKSIVQVGNKLDDGYKKTAGLPLEIFIEQNPSSLKVGSKVSFKIMFEGKPLFGARVSVWNRHNNRTTRQPIFTQQDGRIETHISNPGPWMVSVVKMVASKDPKADWKSYWGSLTFGIK